MLLSTIFYQLCERDIPCWTSDCYAEDEIELFQFYCKGATLMPHVLYLFEKAEDCRISTIPAIILSERPIQTVSSHWIVLKTLPLQELTNMLSQIFSEYQ